MKQKAAAAEWHRKAREEALKEMAREMAKYPDEDWSDTLGAKAREYREDWEYRWSAIFGPFETTNHLSQGEGNKMGITVADQCVWSHRCTQHDNTIDCNRIMIFDRTRDDCQTLTKEDQYLLLTGPARAVVVSDPVYFEAALKVKGSIESEDKDLSFLAVPLTGASESSETCLVNKEYTSRLSTLELTFGFVVESLEAAIDMRVIDESWRDGFRGAFTAHNPSLIDNKVLLLDSGYETVPVNAGRMIKLSRNGVSMEAEGNLTISVLVFGCGDEIKAEKDFTPEEVGMSCAMLDVGFCKMEVPVTWSLLSLLPHGYI